MPAVTKPSTLPPEDINRAKQLGTCIRARFAQTLVGQDNLRESLITTLVARRTYSHRIRTGSGQDHGRADAGDFRVRIVQASAMHA